VRDITSSTAYHRAGEADASSNGPRRSVHEFRGGTFACVPPAAPPDAAVMGLWCERLCVPPLCGRWRDDGARRSWPGGKGPTSMPRCGLRASARGSPPAIDVRPAACLAARRGSRTSRCASCWTSILPVEAGASRRPVALSRGRWRSPASSIAPRASPPERDGSPRARTAQPASLPTCLNASPCARVRWSLSRAWNTSRGSVRSNKNARRRNDEARRR
jgi:hypothetical protein